MQVGREDYSLYNIYLNSENFLILAQQLMSKYFNNGNTVYSYTTAYTIPAKLAKH